MRLGLVHAVVDLDRRCIEGAEGEIRLTELEARLLEHLAQRRGAVVDRAELLTSVWGYHPDVKTRAVDNTVRRLRRKLEVDPKHPAHLVSVYGGGYRLGEVEVLGVAAPSEDEGPRLSGFSEEVDRFFGRADDEARILEAGRSGARLVTLVGPGGVGKTRLAQRMGRRLARELPVDAAWFVDLSACRSTADVATAVGGAVGLFGGDVSPARVGAVLRASGRTLLVLDNFEQVVAAAPETVGRWLADCADARLLVTSRQRLAVPGEVLREVAPLGVEDAAALFTDRARAASGSAFPSQGPDAAAVGELCARLDGLPLALELAAARAGLVGPRQMLEMLGRRFDLLSAGRRGATSRQATLRGAIEWSWETLSDVEREACRRLGVFVSGFDLEAAEAVLQLGPEAPWTLDVLAALVERSLLRSEVAATGRRRFSMLESIRAYAVERLGADPQEAAVRRRHFEHFAARARAAAEEDVEGPLRVARLGADADNLFAAHAWCCVNEPRSAARLAMDIDPLAGRSLALRTRLWEATTEAARGGDAEGLARALRFRGEVRRVAGRLDEADADLAEALEAATIAEAPAIVGRIRHTQGVVALGRGRFDLAERRLNEALEAARAGGDLRDEYLVLANSGTRAWVMSRLDEAEGHYRGALDICRVHGLARGEGMTLGLLGNLNLQRGRLGEAALNFEEAIPVLRRVGDARSEAAARGNLGSIRLEQGAYVEAERMLSTAARDWAQLGTTGSRMALLGNLAILEHLRGDPRRALTSFREALRLATDAGDPRVPAYLRCHRAMASVSAGAPGAAEADLRAAREALTRLDDALGLKLADLAEIAVRRSCGEQVDPSEADIRAAPPDEGPPLAERSQDLRLAVLVLERIQAGSAAASGA